MSLNLRLREDLTKAFENYMRVLVTADQLQKDNIDLKMKVAHFERRMENSAREMQQKVTRLQN